MADLLDIIIAEMSQKLSLNADAPPVPQQVNQAQNGVPQQAPHQQAPPPAPMPVQDVNGTVTGPGLPGLPAAAGTQAGPAIVAPQDEKQAMESQMMDLLAGGVLPQAGTVDIPMPPTPGSPSLGATGAVQGFNAVTPTADAQSMVSLARLLQGGAV